MLTRLKITCLTSPSKLNLGLRIVGRRSDGYHLVESLFWPLEFGDQLKLQDGPLQVTAVWESDAPRQDQALPQGPENLVFRAAEQALGPSAQVQIEIRKRVPLGAGLGGGSSNAGALLRHWVAEGIISRESAERAALALGADLPFFLGNSPAWVEGIGEKCRPVEVDQQVLRDLRFLLILPPEATLTPTVFARYRQAAGPLAMSRPFELGGCLNWKRMEAYLGEAENSLQEAATLEYPLIRDILRELKTLPALYSGLSGTGSTCFAVFRDSATAEKGAQDLQMFCRKSGCRSITTRTFVGS